MADSKIDIEVSHNFDQYNEKLKQSNTLLDHHLATVKDLNNELAKVPKGYASSSGSSRGGSSLAPTGGGGWSPSSPSGASVPGSSNRQILELLFMRETLKYIPQFIKYTKDCRAFTTALTPSGGSTFARMLALAGGAAGASAVAGVSAVGATIGRATSYREKAAQASAYGLTQYQKAAFANVFKDYIGEGGEQGLLGEIVKQKARPGGPSLFGAFLNNYGVKTTGKETTSQLAEKFLLAQRNMAQKVDPQWWTALSSPYGVDVDVGTMMRFKDQGTSQDELMKAIQQEREQGQNFLDKQKDQAIKDMAKEKEAAGQRIGKGWDWLTGKVAPWMVDVFKGVKGPPTADEAGKAGGHSTAIPWGDWFKNWFGGGKSIPDIPITPGLLDRNLPSKNAGEQAFEIPGMGPFAIPSAETVPSNIQAIKDAVTDRSLATTLGGGGGGGGGASGSLFPTYWSGGMGVAGQPRSLTRGGVRGTDAGDISGTAVTQPGETGKYRPKYALSDKALSDSVVSVIAGEAKSGNTAGVDAVVDNMFNRLGTKTYGPSGNLEEVALARGQYTGRRTPSAKEAEFIRSRIKAIASGSLPDITGGSNEYRASWYNGPWRQNHPEGINIGGNVFARNPKGGTSPYAAFGGDGGAALAGVYKDPKDVVDHLGAMRDAGMITNEQCVSLATAAVGIKLGSGKEGANVHDWRRGESAASGNLVAGTPISTFLDRQGRTSNLYAGGGSGTMGAHLDHAAVFENYIREGGNIVGMNVEEQYSGSGGMHSRRYMFGGGFGEADAANYAAIKTAAGGYLGGKNNPMAGDNTRTAGVARPVTPTPHLGDMSMYQQDRGIRMVVRNPSGANISAQTASLGFTNGNIS
jgi:hypothetical protein